MVAGDGSSIEAKPEVKEEEMAVKEEGDQSSHAGDQSMTTATEDIAVHDAVVPDSDFLHELCEANEPGHSLQHPLTSVSLGTLNTGGSKPIALPLGAFSFASS